tara:strand:- start:547420 stop:548832 length:1413 start_codon:yes stop_codon:yes gene_type:complete
MSNQNMPPASPSSIHVSLADAKPIDPRAAFAESPYHEPTLPAGHPLNVGAANARRDEIAFLDLINDVACTANRLRAVECLVGNLARIFPNSSIRCAMGMNRLRRLYDLRLGWLGPQSSLRVEAESRWEMLSRESSEDPGDPESDQSGVVICLPEPDGDGRCVVWIEGENAESSRVDEMEQILPVLLNVFWRRPKFAVPSVLSSLGAKAKTYTAIALAMVALIAVWPIHYPIACTAKVEPLHQRLVSAPFEATLLQANVRPGDPVHRGDALAVLDGRPLRLELESVESELHQTSKEHNVALATGRVADAQQLALKRQGLQRRVDLINDRLQRLTILSPIDGVVVSGDLQRMVGASLELGQTIIEVAPLEQMAIEIEIPDHEIGFVQPDAMTRVRIGALGGRSIRQPLAELYPAAEVREDRNVFVGRVLVENADLSLRPGMRGEATTYGPFRPFAWSWLRGGWERVLWWLGY